MPRKPKTSQPQPLTTAEQFFYDNAGYSYNTEKEGAEDGRRRCAKELAAAERYAQSVGFEFEWRDEEQDNHSDDDERPQTCEWCAVYAPNDRSHILASLGCIDDADANYRRVIEAELALEAMDEYQRQRAEVNS